MGLHLAARARRVGGWVAGSAGLLLLGACSSQDSGGQLGRVGLPPPATDRAAFTLELWRGFWLVAILVGVLVWGLILYAVFRFRRRREDEVPVQTRYNLPIEMLYTVAPIIVVIVLFFFTVQTQDKVLARTTEPSGKSDHTIDVVGQQWSWAFTYKKEDAVGGKNVYTVGTTAEPPTLYLPVNQSVDVNLISPDVIHSFWVPAFLFKLDVVPGRTNSFSFTPTRVGTFPGRCAELCGVYHSRMLFTVKVVSAAEFDRQLRVLQAQGNVGNPLGGENANTVVRPEERVQDDDTSGQGDAQ